MTPSRSRVLDAVLSRYDYTRDLAGQITQVIESVGREVRYEYDHQYRLTHEKVFEDAVLQHDWEYLYDDVGNRKSKADHVGGASTSYLYNANDQLTSETTGSDVTTYGYDDAGNTTTVSVSGTLHTRYTWNHQDQLTSADLDGDGTDDVSYAYDFAGHRVATMANGQTTRSLRDTSLPYAPAVVEYQGAAAIASYVIGLELIEQQRADSSSGDGVAYYLHDAHSGVRQLVDSAGAPTDGYTFDAFGNLLDSVGATPNTRLYRGENRDPLTSFDELGVRPTMNPATGRFLSTDPFDGITTSPHTLHRYSYAHNDPVNYADPSGREETAAGLSASMSISGQISSISNQAALFAGRVAARTAAAFGAGGAAIGKWWNELGQRVQDFGIQVLRQIPGASVTPNLRAVNNVIDAVVKVGNRSAWVEMKYKLPSSDGPALTRLSEQIKAMINVTGGSGVENTARVVWTFRTPTVDELTRVRESVGQGAFEQVQFATGVDGLYTWARVFFNF